MTPPFLIGERIYLRPLEESDIGDDYISWMNDYEVTRYLESGRGPETNASIRNYLERFKGSTNNFIFAIVDRESNIHIGNVTLNDIRWVHGTVNTGLLIGRKEFRGKRIAFEAWSLVIEFAFQRLGLNKIIAGTVVDNVASLATLKKLGFKVEGTLRQEFLVDGEYRDNIRLGLFRGDFYKFKSDSS